MSSRNSHSIRNLNLEVEFQQSDDAFALRNELSEVCKTELLPALEKVFNEKFRNGKIVKAGTIVLDIGTIDVENWNRTLTDQVIQQLTEYLSSLSPAEDTGINGVPEASAKRGSGDITEIGEEENITQSLLQFLQTGLLPWNTVIKTREEFVQHIMHLVNKPGGHFYAQLSATIRDDENALVRLVDQLPTEVLEAMLRLTGTTLESLTVTLRLWTKIFEQLDVSPVKSKQIIYKAAFSAASELSPKKPLAEAISERMVSLLSKDPQRNELVALFRQSERLSFVSLTKEENKILLEVQKLIVGEGNKLFRTVPSSPDSRSISLANVAGLTKSQISGKLRAEVEEDGLFITNAGLVILHPFLTRLFENVGYAQDKKWLSEDHHQRAVMLTQYLVLGKQAYPEFDLLLNKLLTGYPLEMSLPVDIQLSDFELQEADDVLRSVLNHWKALKNTSVAGLQSTFFQRDGKLSYSDDRWLLQVEQKTVDILLNRLPWGIGIIKLPWMESRLHVEWC